MNIRNATKADINNILLLHDSLFSYKWSYDNYANELDFDISSFKVIEYQDQIIAYYILHNIFETLEIIMIVVSKEYQSQGIGQKLLQIIENEKKVNGNDFIYLEVAFDNEQAIKFYEKNSFIKINERKDYYGKGKHAFIYSK
ncbi:ribosomal protein S18-alanine N-acetyltransferase [Mycoplasma sp. P36-A1]|uniref:ribosomal protein S18-alanine N-acetyltransferase n=1 Tax=Mycoplasma sp. P36-A1 TaxID=3252900 RepID=UPI003C2BE17F